jgi:Luciferase-like monooxygenase
MLLSPSPRGLVVTVSRRPLGYFYSAMTSRYGRSLEFGVSIVPTSADLGLARALTRHADESGIDLIGTQDHPYQRRYLATWSLIADLLARSERVRIYPDVANLPLRLPTMIAKQAASLDALSGGRFELGLCSASTPSSFGPKTINSTRRSTSRTRLLRPSAGAAICIKTSAGPPRPGRASVR